jgi:hypothetical protein
VVLQTQKVAIFPNNWVAWVGTSIPAGQTNDAGLLQRDMESFNASFTQADAVVCDGIFHSVSGLNPILISKHVATRSHPLTDQQVEENKIIEDARHAIEQFFSDVKGRFEVLRKEFRFPAKYYGDIFKNCMALHNLHYFGDYDKSEIEAALFFSFDVIEESVPLENVGIASNGEDLASRLQRAKERQEVFLRETCQLSEDENIIDASSSTDDDNEVSVQNVIKGPQPNLTHKSQERKTKRQVQELEHEGESQNITAAKKARHN